MPEVKLDGGARPLPVEPVEPEFHYVDPVAVESAWRFEQVERVVQRLRQAQLDGADTTNLQAELDALGAPEELVARFVEQMDRTYFTMLETAVVRARLENRDDAAPLEKLQVARSAAVIR